MSNRIKRRNREAREREVERQRPTQKCPKCGEIAKHYVPQSLGEPGFFICAKSLEARA